MIVSDSLSVLHAIDGLINRTKAGMITALALLLAKSIIDSMNELGIDILAAHVRSHNLTWANEAVDGITNHAVIQEEREGR